jgi:DNA-binding transcriptional regulator YdaS (Cro superfamily)
MEDTHPLDKPGVRAQIMSALGVSQQVISNWKTRDVPAEYCPRIEAATNGVVRCEELRPDVRWDLVRTKPASKPSKQKVEA